MASGAASDALVPIKGTPRRLRCVLPAWTVPPGEASLSLLTDGGAPLTQPVAVRLRPAGHGGPVLLRARLDRSTPPGRHRAELRVGDETRIVVVDVEPYVRLRAEPSSLSLRGAPATTVSAEFLIENRGNVEVFLPDHAIVGIYSEEGIETAIARAYRADSNDGLEILKTFVTGLRDGYGGLLKLAVNDGAGPIRQGAAQMVRISTTLPSTLTSRRVYSGFWTIESLDYPIRIAVTEGDSNTGRRKR